MDCSGFVEGELIGLAPEDHIDLILGKIGFENTLNLIHEFINYIGEGR